MKKKSRRLVAVLTCRNNGTRLYGKPMQNILDGVSILDQIIHSLKCFESIDQIVLGIAEGEDNKVFANVAHKHNISYLYGDLLDVLMRRIQCGRVAEATDIFRITTECPWLDYDLLEPMWEKHVQNSNDITVCDRLPEGLNFEIYTLESLERSHAKGGATEHCSNYARTHLSEFKVEVFLPPKELRRLDLRITVDNPEDLILCRAVAKAHESSMPLVASKDIISFLDSRPDLKALVSPYVVPEPLWDIL